jgi:hypothetical protein
VIVQYRLLDENDYFGEQYGSHMHQANRSYFQKGIDKEEGTAYVLTV